MGYQKIVVPADGDKITVNADLSLNAVGASTKLIALS